MKYYSITEVAGLLKISSRRLQQLCTSGEIAGAEKAGRKWRIPESSISAKAYHSMAIEWCEANGFEYSEEH